MTVFFAFCVYKTSRAKKAFCMNMKIIMTPISESQRGPFYRYKKQKLGNDYIYMRDAWHFAKSKIICVTFLFTKSRTLYVTRFFMKFLKLGFIYIYKKHDTLRYVTFLYTKSQTLLKKQDNLRHVFKYNVTKSLTLCVTRFFINTLCVEFLY